MEAQQATGMALAAVGAGVAHVLAVTHVNVGFLISASTDLAT